MAKYRASATQVHHVKIEAKRKGWSVVPLTAHTAMPRWYALVVRGGMERRVRRALVERLGVVTYLPVRTAWAESDRTRTRRESEAVVFGGYVFMACSCRLDWPAIRALDGVIGVVAAGGEPLAIDGRLIAAIMERQLRNFAEPGDEALPFKVGERVHIVDGAFIGYDGTVAAVDKKEVEVELSVFGRMTPLSLPLAAVSAL